MSMSRPGNHHKHQRPCRISDKRKSRRISKKISDAITRMISVVIVVLISSHITHVMHIVISTS